ncbi:MAG TPA: lipocalin family protein [Rhodocyclaceae bacterium]
MKPLILPLLLLLAACQGVPDDGRPPVEAVPRVDLQRYAGVWHEIARLPMPFQKQCVGDTTAEYRLRDDGAVAVLNRCRTASGFDQAEGKATVVEGSQNARLKVSFFWPFRADYWIIGLDADYRWAVVGDPSRKYLWVLARSPQLPPEQLEAALTIARAQGYDLSPLIHSQPRPGN